MSKTPRTDKAWQDCIELDARIPLRDECEKLELELAEMSKFRMDLIHEIVEDETNLKRYCAEAGIPQTVIDGDSFYTPFTSGLGELMLEKVKQLESQRDALKARVNRLEEALVAELKNAELRYEQEQRDGDGISIASTRARFIALRDACGILQAKESNP